MSKSLSPEEEKDYELIQRYFDFELEEQELEIVNRRMEEDAAFLERMRIFRSTEEGVLAIGSAQRTAKTVPLSNTRKQGNRTRWRALAAAVTLLIGSAFAFWLFSNPTLSPEELADSYWAESESVTFSNLRSSDSASGASTALVKASDQFRQQNFLASLETLAAFSPTAADYHKATLLKGQIYFEQGEYETAIEEFQNTIDHLNNEYNDWAYWYQALAYLKVDEVELAKENLEVMEAQRYSIPLLEELLTQLQK
jgi:tetratricopeptide (TPR) repeat protein